MSNDDRHTADQPAERTSAGCDLHVERTSPIALTVSLEVLGFPREAMTGEHISVEAHVSDESSMGVAASEDTPFVTRKRTPSSASALNESTEKENKADLILFNEERVKEPVTSRVRGMATGVRVLPHPVSEPKDNHEETNERRPPSAAAAVDHRTSTSASTPAKIVTQF